MSLLSTFHLLSSVKSSGLTPLGVPVAASRALAWQSSQLLYSSLSAWYASAMLVNYILVTGWAVRLW
jgi:hypothetical protein